MEMRNHETQPVRENYVTRARALKACAGLLITMAGITSCSTDQDSSGSNRASSSASELSPDLSTIEYNDPRNSDYSTIGVETTTPSSANHNTPSTSSTNGRSDDTNCPSWVQIPEKQRVGPNLGKGVYMEDIESTQIALEGGTEIPEDLARSEYFTVYEYVDFGLNYLPEQALKYAEVMNGDDTLSCTQSNQIRETATNIINEQSFIQEGTDIAAGTTFNITIFDKFAPEATEQVYVVTRGLSNTKRIN